MLRLTAVSMIHCVIFLIALYILYTVYYNVQWIHTVIENKALVWLRIKKEEKVMKTEKLGLFDVFVVFYSTAWS